MELLNKAISKQKELRFGPNSPKQNPTQRINGCYAYAHSQSKTSYESE